MICPSCRTDNPAEGGLCSSCGGPLRPVAPGTVLSGRYEILAVLGRGGMGTVYSARDRAIGETVAVKVLRPEIAGSPEFAQRFLAEVRLARRVTHPNVCRIHEYGEDGGLRYLVMELVEGRDLASVLAEGRLSPDRALAIAIQAADALSAIHAAGVVHRDLKTANLMVDDAGRVKLMDFGIAKAVGGPPRAAPSGYIVGTPEYMSPEQGRGRAVDARSDIYALGVVIFELHTGRVPFHADTPVGTLMMHVETPPPLDDPALPRPVAGVLRCALAKDPEDRYATAHAMADALRGRRTVPLGRKSIAPSRGTTKVLLVLALVLIAVWWAWRTVETPAPTTDAAVIPMVPPTTPAAIPSPSFTPEPRMAPPTPPITTMPRTPAPRASPLARPPAQSATGTAPPLPIPSPTPALMVEATPPAPPPEVTTTLPRPGGVLVIVKPWADVSIDGSHRGQTPLARIELPPGAHQVMLSHPDYHPWVRRVTVSPGETVRLNVDLAVEAVRRRN